MPHIILPPPAPTLVSTSYGQQQFPPNKKLLSTACALTRFSFALLAAALCYLRASVRVPTLSGLGRDVVVERRGASLPPDYARHICAGAARCGVTLSFVAGAVYGVFFFCLAAAVGRRRLYCVPAIQLSGGRGGITDRGIHLVSRAPCVASSRHGPPSGLPVQEDRFPLSGLTAVHRFSLDVFCITHYAIYAIALTTCLYASYAHTCAAPPPRTRFPAAAPACLRHLPCYART